MVRGLAGTGRVITAAAAIMVAVFLGFATEVDVVVKMLGVGMAVAILLDATIVRMVLVPATMSLLGRRNWWLPGLARPRAAHRATPRSPTAPWRPRSPSPRRALAATAYDTTPDATDTDTDACPSTRADPTDCHRGAPP